MTTGIVASSPGEFDSIAARCAKFLAWTYPGRNANKKVQGAFGVSLTMARELRAGRYWTLRRVQQAMLKWPNFQGYVFGRPETEMQQQIDRLLTGVENLSTRLEALNKKIDGQSYVGNGEIKNIAVSGSDRNGVRSQLSSGS
jgi:hypothetical protein